MMHQRAADLFLLMFYFGGQDLKDIYYLEQSQINNGRIYFQRGKLSGNGYEFDLKITKKAQIILDKYTVAGKYVFAWRKDFAGYKHFRDNLRRSFDKLQELTKIQVLPMGGELRIKVARHTFATIGKQLFVETDLLRELMGHERDDVDTIYKDKYPQEVRDLAQLKIIS
jgi:integrase